MSKIVAGTAFVLLGGATVAGGVLLHKGSGATTYDSKLPQDLKDKVHEEGCVTQLFGTQAKFETTLSVPQDSDWSTTAPNTFFPQGKDTTGCLVVNWDKKTSSDSSKWSGNFRFLWAVKGETKGFIVVLMGSSQKAESGTDHKIAWQGGGYIMEATTTGDNTTWQPKKKSSTQDNTAITKTDVTKFPHPGAALTTSGTPSTISDFWGWISGADDLAKIADDTELNGGTDSSLRAYWEWKGQHKDSPAANKKLLDWTKEFDTWCGVVFGQSKLKVKEVSDKQEGTWTNRHYKKLPESSETSA